MLKGYWKPSCQMVKAKCCTCVRRWIEQRPVRMRRWPGIMGRIRSDRFDASFFFWQTWIRTCCLYSCLVSLVLGFWYSFCHICFGICFLSNLSAIFFFTFLPPIKPGPTFFWAAGSPKSLKIPRTDVANVAWAFQAGAVNCEGFHVGRVRMILMGFNYDSIGTDWIYMEFTLQ